MAQWYHFYHNEDDAEIKVGVYDRWLRQVGYGPTQAERYLVHTEMMDLAHERRFVVAECGLDMSDFEQQHSQRVGKAISHLEKHFIDKSLHNFYDPVDYEVQLNNKMFGKTRDVADSGSDILLGLIPPSTQEGPEYVKSLSPSFCDPQPPGLFQSLQLLSDLSVPNPRSLEDISEPIDADDMSSDGFQEVYLAALENAPRKRPRRSSAQARQLKEVRLRKDVKRLKSGTPNSRPS
ncbi:hypothetical protein H2198_007685 [Neophaeococcomyces mojaviensis]|uniref:Uncharacterized protein n=1 Tax=Neophaeococcomyces mojaviensis TaxID=3383035 RepID=A0ACC2ZZE1_9EURO|nr:hypothetical protein H2198_007685 [Knufia sp. JES_112]